MRRPRILLSAYACEPGKGSEPGVGWQWALGLACLGYEVWVLTRANNQRIIEEALPQIPEAVRPRFLYYDLPYWARWWKRGARGVQLYCRLWQWGAYRLVLRMRNRKTFDLVHHITFGVFRHPSFMGRLGIPFIFGPVGGGERAPWRLRFGYGLRGFLLDGLRDAANFMVRVDPFMLSTFRDATFIFAKTSESRNAIPKRFRNKVHIQLEIGISSVECSDSGRRQNAGFGPRVLYMGRFVYWKGMHLGLPAFAELAKQCSDAHLTLVGSGPEEARWRRLAQKLELADRLTWIPMVGHHDVQAIYRDHNVLLFPSLHDSSGNVVLEALAHGLPIVCLETGGPRILVDDSCGRVIPIHGCSADAVIQGLSEALLELANAPSLQESLAKGAMKRAEAFTWTNVVQRLYATCEGTAPILL